MKNIYQEPSIQRISIAFEDVLTASNAVTKKATPPPRATTTESASVCKSKIFINGEKPYGTDCMGILMIDDPDQYVMIHYSEAPIEVDVTPGNHFVVIGAGEHFDEDTPALRREIYFEKDTVLTVDIASQIRFQKINYAEYEKALRDSSFQVTKKRIG